MSTTKTARYKVGQVVMVQVGKRELPMKILSVVESNGDFFYKYDRKNAVHEAMVRPLTAEEKGDE
jgi:hypothetical protein